MSLQQSFLTDWLMCYYRQRRLLAYEGLLSGSVEDASMLLLPSLGEVIQSMDKQSLWQLQSALCTPPASRASILRPLIDNPTLVQVVFDSSKLLNRISRTM